MVQNLVSKGIVLPAYILMLVAFYSIVSYFGFPQPLNGEMLLYKLIIRPFFTYYWLNIATSALLITAIAFTTSSFINKYYLTGLRTHLPLFLNFMLFTAGSLFMQITPGLISVLIILFALNATFEAFDKDNVVFDANTSAIGISIASLLYLPFVYCIPFLFIAYAIIKQMHIKTGLAIITGSIVLPIIFGGLFFYYDMWNDYTSPLQFIPTTNNIIPSKGYWLFLGVITIWTIIAYIFFVKQAPLKKIRPRKIYNIINVIGLCSIIAMLSGYASIINVAPVVIIMILFLINHMYPLLSQRLKIVFLASTISTYLFSFVNTL